MNVLERVIVGGRPAFHYYDHCFVLGHHSVLVSMGRHEGYELLGYEHASASAVAVGSGPSAKSPCPPVRSPTIDTQTLNAFPSAYPSVSRPAKAAAGSAEQAEQLGALSSDRIFWGSKLLRNGKASMKRCLALARQPTWHAMARSMGIATPERYALMSAEAVYVSSPREDAMDVRTLASLHPDRGTLHLPVSHPFVDRLFATYVDYAREFRARTGRQGLAFTPPDLVTLAQLVPRQDVDYFYVSNEALLRVQEAMRQVAARPGS
jgi:hypothetical protein